MSKITFILIFGNIIIQNFVAPVNATSLSIDRNNNDTLPENYGFFTNQLSNLQSIFRNVVALEKQLIFTPLVPSRLSKGFFLYNVLANLLRVMPFNQFISQIREGVVSRTTCLTCSILTNLYMSRIFSKDVLGFATRSVCVAFRLQTPEICAGIVNSFLNTFNYIRTNTKLSKDEMCGVFLGLECIGKLTENLSWKINLPKKEDNKIAKSVDIEPIEIIQVTDIHYDPYYKENMHTYCDEPVCCRTENNDKTDTSGFWGDYTDCDTPFNTMENTLKRITRGHANIKYWMWTGDIPPHDIWNYKKDETLSDIQVVTLAIKNNAKVPVYPAVGNHEQVPINSFPPPEIDGDLSSSWLYGVLSSEWSTWLTTSSINTLGKAGHYMEKPITGLRIITINSNYCARLNPWSLFDPIDPGQQLKFLADELLAAELAGDKVHIVGHVPPDNRECTQAWLYNFMRIIERFQDTVKAQFYGHTHRDEFRVLYSLDNSKEPIGLEFVGPSVTSYSQTNPAYRVYSVSSTGEISGYKTYIFNLTEANKNNSTGPSWYEEYSAKDLFNVTSFTPKSMDWIVKQLESDESLFNKYHRIYYVQSDVSWTKDWDQRKRSMLIGDHRVINPYSREATGFIPIQ